MIAEISERRALAMELLDLSAKIRPEAERISEVKERLKTLASLSGSSFRETVAGKGEVKVRPASDGSFKGLLPVLDPELFLASDEAEQERLKTSGIVRIDPVYGRGSYAAVTVTLTA